MKKGYVILMAALLLLVNGIMAGQAQANQGCPHYDMPRITVVQFSGMMFQDREQTAFELARQKSKRYGFAMPMQQGNLGEALFKDEIQIDMKSFPNVGCIVVTNVRVKVVMDHKIQIAKDFEDGSCLYNEFSNLENELMRQDEDIVNAEMRALRAHVKETIGMNHVYGPVVGLNIDEAKYEWKKEMEDMLRDNIARIKDKIETARIRADDPAFYDEIGADCAGAGRE